MNYQLAQTSPQYVMLSPERKPHYQNLQTRAMLILSLILFLTGLCRRSTVLIGLPIVQYASETLVLLYVA
jgi:hypothetical protein